MEETKGFVAQCSQLSLNYAENGPKTERFISIHSSLVNWETL